MPGKRIDIAIIPSVLGTFYPPPFDAPCRSRERQKLGDAAGLTQFGVNMLRLSPGAWSSQRHWHSGQDEFIYVVTGEVMLVTEGLEERLIAGDAAGFRAGEANGHCLQNRSNAEALVLEIGTRVKTEDQTTYPDIDLISPAAGQPAMYTHRDGTPYEGLRRRGPGG